jgi:uncharacterized protein (TIGR02266 family)
VQYGVPGLTLLRGGPYAFRVEESTQESTATSRLGATPAGLRGAEHRQHERVLARLRCWCEAENVTFYARVANISEGGLFLRTSTPLPKGARTHLRLAMAGPDNIEAPAEVMWTRDDGIDGGPPGMGLRFEKLDESSLSALRKIIFEQHGKK